MQSDSNAGRALRFLGFEVRPRPPFPHTALEISNANQMSGSPNSMAHGDSENPPHPYALIEALRSVGYTPSTALADLIDNSISAGARTIRVAVEPSHDAAGGYAYVDDDGAGMSSSALRAAMRWGGDGGQRKREATDLGRFGLGLKTASFSLGRTLSVISRTLPGADLSGYSWDLDHIAAVGWRMLDGYAESAARIVADSRLARDDREVGTLVVVTNLDRLGVGARSGTLRQQNTATTLRHIASHVGMVFHRFLTTGVEITLGEGKIQAWDPFEGGVQTAEEYLGKEARVTSFVLPHQSRIATALHERLAGPRGWLNHQGFLIYRAKRLIVPGGWLRLCEPQERYRLARVRVDLETSVDSGWKLNVMKSAVTAPSGVVADLERIGGAVRRQAEAAFGFRGERQAPSRVSEGAISQAFWRQEIKPDSVRFRVNRSHPLIQTLKQQIRDPEIAEPFLKAFERLLPLDAILQDPKRTTNGAAEELASVDIGELAGLARRAIALLERQKLSSERARQIVLGADPFLTHASTLAEILDE